MIYHLVTLLLLPLFILQGKYVRKVTTKLSEPVGMRSGNCGAGDTSRLLVVGDSAAAGVGAVHQSSALIGQLVKRLSATRNVSWQLLAFTGDNAAKTLKRLDAEQQSTFDIAVISVGVNDVTGFTSTKDWANNLQAIINTLSTKFAIKQIYFSAIPPMQYFPALPQPLRWWLGKRAKKLNAIMHRVSAANSQCVMVNTPFVLDKQYLAEDGFHPAEPAYLLWAEHLGELIETTTNQTKLSAISSGKMD